MILSYFTYFKYIIICSLFFEIIFSPLTDVFCILNKSQFFWAPLTIFRIDNLSKDFNWNQFTFNWYQFTSIDFQLISIYCPLTSICFQRDFVFFSLPKVVVHTRVPSKQLYYWWSEPFMGYALEKLFGSCFLNKGLIRHRIIWKTWHLRGFHHTNRVPALVITLTFLPLLEPLNSIYFTISPLVN